MTYRGFTEAVPLSLSSMAHMTMPLEEGVLDGLKQVLQHTLLSCVNYARAMHPPHNFTFRDLTTSPIAWEPHLIKKNTTSTNTSTTNSSSSATEGGGGGDSTKNGGSDNNNHNHHTHHHTNHHHHHSHNQHENDIPASLAKMGYQHQYHRTAFVYLKKSTSTTDGESSSKAEFLPKDKELQLLQSSEEDWTPESNILGRISLRYATTALMTPGELNGTEQEDDDEDDDTPKCVLYKVLVEYRSLPATGNKAAVQAEELSMLSFGGSVDDDVKYGALAALYDTHAKYVLEIYSVRGKKYKFDLMDSTLSDGTVPRLPVRNNNNTNNNNGVGNNNNKNGTNGAGAGAAGSESQDPFVKSLCVTVTDHIDVPPVTVIKAMPPPAPVVVKKKEEEEDDDDDEKEKEDDNDKEKEEKEGEDASSKSKKSSAETTTTTTPPPPKKQYALTKIHLTMEGNLRNENDLPPPHAIAEDIQATFLALNHNPPDMATATPSGHTLLLDPKEAGKVYINGRYVTTWGNDPKIGSHFPALFGMDLHSIPYWHGRIFDFDALKRNYAQLWQEILIDAKLVPMNIGGKLLSRFISGKDPVNEDDDDDDDDDDDEELLEESDEEEMDDDEEGNAPPRVDTGIDSLESQVMQSTTYDPVGISAKALATKFKMEYGEEGFPCLAHEIDWVKNRLPGRVPVAVPERLISVLRRGGYFDTKRTADEVWFSESRPATEGMETELVNKAVELLIEAGCADVHANMIVFFSGAGISDAVQKKGLVRFNRAMRQYHVNESFLKMDLSAYGVDSSGSDGEKMMTDDDDAVPANIPQRAHLLGLHISQEHQDGSVLLRYLLKHSNIPKEEEGKKPEEEKEKVEDKEDDGDGEPAEKKRKI